MIGLRLVFVLALCLLPLKAAFAFSPDLEQSFQALDQLTQITVQDVDQFWQQAQGLADPQGRVTSELQVAFTEFEKRYHARLTPEGRQRFQTIVAWSGARLAGEVQLPEGTTPYWFRARNELAHFRSRLKLPQVADVVVIGLGLTGGAATYHLKEAARAGQKIVALDMGAPASQASGRNGGNFELIPENYIGVYEGLLKEREKFIRETEPGLSNKDVQKKARQQTELVFRFGARNGAAIAEIARHEGLDADLSQEGWLRIASSLEEEPGIRSEVDFARSMGIDMQLVSPSDIEKRFGIPAKYVGRFAAGFGNYHPVKFVNGILMKSLQAGVEVHTDTKVVSVVDRGEFVEITTNRGVIRTGKVVVATNAFTSELFPQLKDVQFYESFISNYEHVLAYDAKNRRGLVNPRVGAGPTVTEQQGDMYYNFPRSGLYQDAEGNWRGTLHIGGGLDRPGIDPYAPKRPKDIFNTVHQYANRTFPETKGQPPSNSWSGPMAMTPDRLPVLGFLDSRRIVFAVGFNGYGGTYSVEAGRLAAQMALSGRASSLAPESIFGPKRLIKSISCTRLLRK